MADLKDAEAVALIVYLEQWLEAYPYDVFPRCDLLELAEDGRFTRDEVLGIAASNAAEMARHVLRRVRGKLIELRDRAELDDGL